MTSDSVFISYARRHQADVKDLISYLEDVGLNVWYDGRIRTGDFRDWIADGIRRSRAMIVLLTEESVGPKSSGWIEKEIDMARDSGLKNLILPCYIGDFVAPPDLVEKITFLQSVSCPSISELHKNIEFRQHVQFLKDLIDGKAGLNVQGFAATDAVTPAGWFASDPPPSTSSISLALATMLLEYQSADLVIEAAREIEASIESRLGEKTEEERAQEPRALSMTTASERFALIRAERVTLPDPGGMAQPTVLRFKDRNWRGALLRHVWDEMDQVREVFFDWMAERLQQERRDVLDQAIVRTLGSLSQHDLHSLRHRLLNAWLLPNETLRPVFLAADIIASAVENEANLHQVREMLMPLAEPQRGSKAVRLYCKFLATVIALGRLALRRPDLSIEVMKKIGRELFVDPTLRQAARRSPALYGQKETESSEELSELTLTISDEEPPTPEPDGPDNCKDQTTLPDLTDEGEVAGSRAVPAAMFLAALADWADQAAPDTEAVLERQTPIAALMFAFLGMPLLSTEDSTRLTLQDLTAEIAGHDRDVVRRIVAGFVRAGVAKRRLGYLPRREMQLVFKSFAHERAALLKKGEPLPDPDPYLAFAGLVYAALAERDTDRAGMVLDGSDRWTSDEDKLAVQSGGPLNHEFNEENT